MTASPTETPSNADAADASAPVHPAFSLRFSARDLVNVAIFAVIYFVIEFAVSMIGIIGPLVMLLTLPLSIILGGVPFMLFLTRVRHAGMVTLFGIVVGVLNLLVGLPIVSTLLTIALAIIADLVVWLGRYRSKWAAIWSYAVFSIWFFGPFIPFVLDREGYLASDAMQMMGAEYVAEFDAVVSPMAMWIYLAATVVCGVVGGLLGAMMLRKHFVRAGLA